jgi:hypothetical protein
MLDRRLGLSVQFGSLVYGWFVYIRRLDAAAHPSKIPDFVWTGKTNHYSSGDGIELAQLLSSLLEDPALREQMGDRGRALIV